jgi:hypothetical protein
MTPTSAAGPKLVVDRATKFYDTKSGPLHALDNFSMSVACPASAPMRQN